VAPGAGTPTGWVQFQVDGASVGSPVALSGGMATYTTSALTHGFHAVEADYAGDGDFLGATALLAPNQLVDTPPVAGPYTLTRTGTNGAKVSIAALLSNDTDADGDPITFVGASAASASGGTVTSSAGWLFYTPPPGFTNTDSFTYTISDGFAAPVTGVVTVNLRIDKVPSSNLTITSLGNGSYAVQGDGLPGYTCRLQSADDAGLAHWQDLATVTADANGLFLFIDTNGGSWRFYRSVYP
jgi:hypothetical protein